MKTPRRALAVIGAAALVLIAGPAWAAGPYTVTAGGTDTGTTAYTGSAGTITFTSPGATVTCSSGTAAGSITLGASADGAGIGSIDESSFSSCKGPFGLTLNVAQTQPWSIDATGTPTGGVTAGTISDVAASVTSSGFIPCSFKVSGSVGGSLDANAQTLNVGIGTGLTISDVSGCVGFVSNGQVAQMSGSYAIDAEAGAVAITSP